MSKTAEDYAKEADAIAGALARMKRAEDQSIEALRAMGFNPVYEDETAPELDPAAEVTPDMIDAGLRFLYSFDREWGVDTAEEIVEKIYRAMSFRAGNR